MFAKLRRVRSQNGGGAVALLTFHKCGSQWIRDLLTHELALNHTGFSNARISANLAKSDRWPELSTSTVVGPVYNASPRHWLKHKSPDDKAIIVLRDPRDMIVSLHYSRAYSHVATKSTERLRNSMLSLPMQQSLMICINIFQRRYAAFAGWGTMNPVSDSSCFVTSYEKMVADTESELAAVFSFLDWSIPRDDVTRIVNDLAFETRSGRQRGDEDIFSHYRKGVAGDWRQHFDRACGVLFEQLYPELLVQSGYEEDPLWFEKLPIERDGSHQRPEPEDLKTTVELQAEIVRLREEIKRLKRPQARRRVA